MKIICILTLHCLGAASLKADEWAVDAGIDQSISYDDNVTMRANSEASLIYELTPIINFSHRTPVSDLSAYASYGFQKFFDISALDRDNQKYGIDGQYLTDRVTLGLTTAYSITPGRDSAELDSGDFGTDSERKNFTISPSIAYRLSAKDSLILSGSYSDTRYSSATFNDNDNKSLDLTWSHGWTERLRSSINIFYSEYESSGQFKGVPRFIESDSGGINISSTYLLSETWELFLTVGGRGTDTQIFIPGQSTAKDSSAGFLLDSGFNYSGENLTGQLKLNRSLIPSTQGGLNEQSRFSLDMGYQMTERLSAAMLISYQEIEQISTQNFDVGNDGKRTNLVFHPSVSWRMTPDWTLSTSYRFRYQERPVSGGSEEANSNLYMFSVNYSWPGLSIAR